MEEINAVAVGFFRQQASHCLLHLVAMWWINSSFQAALVLWIMFTHYGSEFSMMQ